MPKKRAASGTPPLLTSITDGLTLPQKSQAITSGLALFRAAVAASHQSGRPSMTALSPPTSGTHQADRLCNATNCELKRSMNGSTGELKFLRPSVLPFKNSYPILSRNRRKPDLRNFSVFERGICFSIKDREHSLNLPNIIGSTSGNW